MSRLVTSPAKYRKGVLVIVGRSRFAAACAKTLLDGPCEVTVRQKGKEKSIPQRGYLWYVVYSWLEAYFTDSDKKDVHEACKLRFNPIKIRLPNGEALTYGGSTEEFDAGDYARYTDKIRDWAALPIAEGGLSLYIPGPRKRC